VHSRDTVLDFAPDVVNAQEQPPSPLPRAVLYSLLALFAVMLVRN